MSLFFTFNLKAKNSLNEAASTSNPPIEGDKLERLQTKLSSTIFTELDGLTEYLIKLNKVVNEAEHFKQLENRFRQQV